MMARNGIKKVARVVGTEPGCRRLGLGGFERGTVKAMMGDLGKHSKENTWAFKGFEGALEGFWEEFLGKGIQRL